jgi:hypothetical protein
MALFHQFLKGQESHESPPIASPLAGRFAYSDEFITEIGALPCGTTYGLPAQRHVRRCVASFIIPATRFPGARMARTQRWGLHIAVGAASWIRVRCCVRCCREQRAAEEHVP